MSALSTGSRQPDDHDSHCHLLGLYLGDGHLVTAAKVPVLRVYCADVWPGSSRSASGRAREERPPRAEDRLCRRAELFESLAVFFPQHGPGHKHERPIYLADWRQPLVDADPGSVLHGLIHSDGCRVTNRLVRAGKAYFHPRYMFSNESADIMELFQRALDRLGVGWRMCRRNLLSVARRRDVAELDQYVGPKC